MKVPFLDLRIQYETIQDELEQAALRVLRSGHYVLGEELKRFERNFAAYCDVPHAVGVASGTDAIRLALMASGVGPGDDVLTVANVSAPTVCAILATGARPVLIDIDRHTYCMDPERLRECLTHGDSPSAKVVLPVHLYGRQADMPAIRSIATEFGLSVVVDAAQAHGVGQGTGFAERFGDIGCFSMYPTKNLGACGDAGVVVARDAITADRLRRMRNYGEIERYDNRELGINSRLDEIQAALLNVKLNRLDAWNRRRREIAAAYDEAFGEIGLIAPGHASPGAGSHVHHLYVIAVDDRDRFMESLAVRGVGAAVHYRKPIHRQPAFRNRCATPHELTHTDWACDSVISLPLWPEMKDEHVEFVIAAVVAEVRNRECILQNTGS
jgi:dTDP-4-amino-4,6-dideoxygalactose transaminase